MCIMCDMRFASPREERGNVAEQALFYILLAVMSSVYAPMRLSRRVPGAHTAGEDRGRALQLTEN